MLQTMTASRPLALAMVGDVTDPGVASGTPYFALSQMQRQGHMARGLRLGTEGRLWQARRLAWNGWRKLRSGTSGGYQYSDAFLDRLWRTDPPRADEDVINMFQLSPARLLRHHPGRLFHFVDQTLMQMFDTYGLTLPQSVMQDALAREKASYQRATMVFTQSRYAAASVVADYGVPEERVRAVVCGANLDPDQVAGWEAQTPETRPDGPLRLVFVGKDWRRKGLDRLLDGIRVARGQGADLTLRVIGVTRQDVPHDLAEIPGVDWVGFVDKGRDQARFISLVGACDLGCLLSSAEAGGMSLREFCRLGLVTLAPAVGGSPEYVVPGASHLLGAQAGADEIATVLIRLAKDPDALATERAIARATRAEADWGAAIAQLTQHISECPA